MPQCSAFDGGNMIWLALAVIAYLIYRNYQLEKRWRAMRYCWQCMSDLAGHRLKGEEGHDAEWRETVGEHARFMGRFGAQPLSPAALELYEEALVERNIEPLNRRVF